MSLPLRAGGLLAAGRQKTRYQLGGAGETAECPPNSSQWDACVCASVRTQPTGAPRLSVTLSRKRAPASPPSQQHKVQPSDYKCTKMLTASSLFYSCDSQTEKYIL